MIGPTRPLYTATQRLEATEWFIEVYEAKDPSPEMLTKWRRWLDASDGNRAAFRAVEEAWRLIPRESMVAMESSDTEDYDGTLSVHDWLIQKSVRSSRLHRTPSRMALWTIAASVVISIGAGWWVISNRGPLWRISSGELNTRVAEDREVRLADGSHITMGAKTQLTVRITAKSRDVMLDAGEAFFTIAKDRHRPFRVHVPNGIITAVGTEFNVRAASDHVTVAVTEGIVSVTGTDPSSSGASIGAVIPEASGAQVARGQQITFGPHNNLKSQSLKLAAIDPRNSSRWREGWFVYHNEPLRDVIADISRYSERRIELKGAAIEDLRFTGVVSKYSVIEWVDALPSVFAVSVVHDKETIVVNIPAP